ncbi:MAG: hypothetical protein J7L69_11255 [Desulfobulbaceae bacterium]|nr:hypothetical protein [Desulfobulbaceae bacterium]
MRESLETWCLDVYLNQVLELVARLPVPRAYRFIATTGRLFRSRGVLKKAEANVRRAGICVTAEASSVIREYLRFETRYVLEDIWLRKNIARKIVAAFRPDDVAGLQQFLKQRNYIITLPHTACNTFIGLAHILAQVVVLGSVNPLKMELARPTPIQKTILGLYSRWLTQPEFVFVEDGSAFARCCQVLGAGKSLIILSDTPFHSEQNVCIDFLGRRTGVAAGVAVLAERCKVPILAVVPWAADCCQPYRLETRIIEASDIVSSMRKVFAFFETFIEQYPACWQGWMYWDLMDHEE